MNFILQQNLQVKLYYNSYELLVNKLKNKINKLSNKNIYEKLEF